MAALLAFNRRFWLPLTFAVLAAISLLSLTPLPELPLRGPLASDKLHHLVAYAALAFPVALARPRFWLLWLAAFAAWSGAIELIQPFVNRYGEWIDLAANMLGLALGAGLAALLRRAVPARRREA